MSQIQQVLHGGGCGVVVIDADVGAVLNVATHHHQRNVDLVEVLQFVLGQGHAEHQQGVDLLVHHGGTEEAFTVAAVATEIEQGEVVFP